MKRYYIHILLYIVLIVGFDLITHAMGRSYYLTQLTMSFYYSMVVLGLVLLMGYAGQISLGHAGFFAIGGYSTAVLSTINLLPYKENQIIKLLHSFGLLVMREDLYGDRILSFHPWVGVITAVVLAGIIAYLIGIPVLKLKGHYLAMATLGFGIIVYRIVLGTALFGEADGISDVPPFQLFPGIGISGELDEKRINYYIAAAMVLIVLFLLTNLINSRVGRALRAIHGSEEAAQAAGIDTAGFKLKVFVLSSVVAAVAGAFLTHYNGGIGPGESSVMKSVRYVAIVAAGGMASLWGGLITSMVLNFLSLRGYFGSYDDAVFGAVLIVIMLFAPEGIINLKKILNSKH
ncbi:MAG: branched-chain amino acid ABC transporter permease [Nitrospirae bacterium]|nr:MAG: branched-chain amino acid ABC transporter permease [Nitrospirota bacterium]